MDKNEARVIIYECAKLYSKNLLGKSILFISQYNNKINYIETVFLKGNFAHLTGVILKNITANAFYDKCINGTLSFRDFEIKDLGTTKAKLSVLPKLMNIYSNSNMMGDFNCSKPKLYADKLVGNINACLGFRRENDTDKYYFPVTTLREDIRDYLVNNKIEKIIAIIFSKPITETSYRNLSYSANKIENIQNLNFDVVKNLIDINNITCSFQCKDPNNNLIIQKLKNDLQIITNL